MIPIFIPSNHHVVNLLLISNACHTIYFTNVKTSVLLTVKTSKNNIVYSNCWEKSPDPRTTQCYILFDLKISCDIGSNLHHIPNTFMKSEITKQALLDIIRITETRITTQEQIDSLYDEFCKTIINEMEELIPQYDWSAKTKKRMCVQNHTGTTN